MAAGRRWDHAGGRDPAALLRFVIESDAALAPAGPADLRLWVGLLFGASGLALAVRTVRLFRMVEGTPAPWAPPKQPVGRGPYRHVRNPAISGVLPMLAAESLCFGSWHLAAWMAVFFLGTAAWFPLVEEPALERRFGDSYRLYKATAPRWIPRLPSRDRP